MRPAIALALSLAGCATAPSPEPPGGIDVAISRGLIWLARHQSGDGSWKPERFVDTCPGAKCSAGRANEEYRHGVTSLALLAFLESGHGAASAQFGPAVSRGIRWLLEQQQRDGGVGDPTAHKFIYGHSLATRALARAWVLTREDRLKFAAQRALDFLLAAQKPDGGWRDSSVTGWCLLALRTAERCGLAVPPGAYDGPNRWFDGVTTRDHDVGYTSVSTPGRVMFPGDSTWWDDHDTLVAFALLLKSFSVRELPQERRNGFIGRLARDLPAWEGYKIDFVYWHCGTLAMRDLARIVPYLWQIWRDAVQSALLTHQVRDSGTCGEGSWDPRDERWGFDGGGPIYTTAITILTLQASLGGE